MSELRYQLRYALPLWIVQLLLDWLPDNRIAIRLRGWAASLILPGRPRGLTLGRDVTFLSIHRLNIGSDVYIAKGCWMNAIGGLTIEDEVNLAPYVVIATSAHGFKDGSVKRGGAHPAPVTIGFGTWLAAHVVVAAGVRIGRGNLVGANAVVTSDTPNDVIVGGVPAKVLRLREDNPSDLVSKHHA